ncbi:MAG: hypothetical protein ABI675_17965 [Chitinophagaceae bacterium]
MKVIYILTHPVLVLSLFCTIMINGESFGGPYLLYVLMAIPHGGIHAILALTGAGIILFGYGKYHRQSKFIIDPLLNIIGTFSLYLSLLFFFYRSWDYNEGTFAQTVPLLSIALFGAASFGSLIWSVTRFAKTKPNELPAY